jgi:DNA-binding NarL/FixJ family response regulator
MSEVGGGLAAEAPPLELSLSGVFQGVSRLRAEATALVSRWNDWDEDARLAALKEIEGRAEQLEAMWLWAPDGDSSTPVAELTRRELEVLQVLADGASTPQAATRLNVSVSTIRSHIKSILAKLGVHSRTEAVAFALRHRLVPIHEAHLQRTHRR